MERETYYLECVPKAEFNLASLTGSYQALNGSGFSNSVKILKIYNPSATVSIDVSLDGVNNHDFIPPLSTLIVDVQANHNTVSPSGGGTLRVGTNQILYGKTAANPTFLQMVGYY